MSLNLTTTKCQQPKCIQYVYNSQQETIKYRKISIHIAVLPTEHTNGPYLKTTSFFSSIALAILISNKQARG